MPAGPFWLHLQHFVWGFLEHHFEFEKCASTRSDMPTWLRLVDEQCEYAHVVTAGSVPLFPAHRIGSDHQSAELRLRENWSSMASMGILLYVNEDEYRLTK